MYHDIFGSLDGFIYGDICSDRQMLLGLKRKRIDVEMKIKFDKETSRAVDSDFLILTKSPRQTGKLFIVKGIQWDMALKAIRKVWGCTQLTMAEIMGMAEKTVLNIEQGKSQPNTKNREKIVLIKELTDFLCEVVEKKHSIKKIINTQLPALGMVSPKEYLREGDISSFRELLGIFKRIYR